MTHDGHLHDERVHTDRCHERWLSRRNRRMEDPEYRDQWRAEQCGRCCYWIMLAGTLATDWGVCSNSESEFDGIVRFEHDGCGAFADAGIWAGDEEESG